MADLKTLEEYEAALEQVNEDLRRFGQVTAETADRLKKAEKKNREYEQQVTAVTNALSGLGSAALSTTAALYRGEQGAKVFGKTVSDASGAIGDFISIIGFIVPALKTFRFLLLGAGQVLKLFGKAVEVTTEQSDKLFDSYEALSKSGSAAADGMVGIYRNLRDLGYGIEELDKFTTLIGSNSEVLARLAKTAGDGRKQFAAFAGAVQGSRVGHELRLMGININTINEGSIAYLRLQTQVGMAQKMTQEELAAGASKYLVEMDALTKATGIQRAELEREMERARSEQRFRAKLDEMRASGDANQIAAADKLERTAAIMAQTAPQAAQGLRDMTTGFVNSEAAQKLYVATQGKGLQIAKQLTKNQLDEGQALDGFGKSLGENTKRFRVLAQTGGYEIFGDYAEQSNFAAKSTKGWAASIDAARKQQVQQVKEGDSRVKSQVELRERQRELRDSFQDLIDQGIDPTIEALRKLSGASGYTAKSSKEAKAAADKINDTVIALQKQLSAVENEAISDSEQAEAMAGGYDPTAARDSRAAKIRDQIAAEQRKLSDARYEQRRLERRESRDRQGGVQGIQGSTSGARSMTVADLKGLGLRVKEGDVQQDGQEINPKLISLAQAIQSQIGGFSHFTGFNDRFHNEKSPNSKHTSGRAADFVLNKKPTVEEGKQLISTLKSLGASVAIDEYNNPSAKSTGGHIHVEVPEARYGAILSGPASGYRPNIEMHGTEMIAPLDGNPIPVRVVEALDGMSAANNGVMVDLLKQNNDKLAQLAANIERFLSGDMSRAQLGKLDEISQSMRNSVDINTKILQAARQG